MINKDLDVTLRMHALVKKLVTADAVHRFGHAHTRLVKYHWPDIGFFQDR
ncbi:MAG: hypothetical protein NVSMB6_18240 [Burkholderiaceae bacterium]